MSLEQVVEASGLQPRYVEEWLKGMACAGYLDYEPASERFQLSPEHAYLLASDGTDHFAGGLFGMAPAFGLLKITFGVIRYCVVTMRPRAVVDPSCSIPER